MPYRSCWTMLQSRNSRKDLPHILSFTIRRLKCASCILKIYWPCSLPEPSIIILLQVCGDAPLHRLSPAPQLQSVSCLHTYSLSHLLKLPSVYHLYVAEMKSNSIADLQSFCIHISKFTVSYSWNTCVRKVCAGAAGVALTLGLAVTDLGPLFVDFPGLLGLVFLPGVVLCSWASFWQ